MMDNFRLKTGNLILGIISILATACGSSVPQAYSSQMTSDFTPPSGGVYGPGPATNRLMTALSTDGLTFVRTGRIVTDQGAVPDLAVDKEGRVYLYYVGWTVGNEKNKTVVAISGDGGETWVYKKTILSGFEGMTDPVDPEIQILANGTFRLYLTSANREEPPFTYYADSPDGIHFEMKGKAFSPDGNEVLDPSVILIGSTWHIYGGGSTSSPEANQHGTSRDGKIFTSAGEETFIVSGRYQRIANGIQVPGGYRFYTFNNSQPGIPATIYSFSSSAGVSWNADPDERLALDTSSGLENKGVWDPAVVRTGNNKYLMVYTTVIPGF